MMFWKKIQYGVLAFVLVLLAGCAASRDTAKVEHGFDVKNVGESQIALVVIQYGDMRRVFCDPVCKPKRPDGFYGVYMPIQDSFAVTWRTAEGKQYEALVPVRERVLDIKRFRRMFLQFNEANLVVLQGSYFKDPSQVGWEQAPLYP